MSTDPSSLRHSGEVIAEPACWARFRIPEADLFELGQYAAECGFPDYGSYLRKIISEFLAAYRSDDIAYEFDDD